MNRTAHTESYEKWTRTGTLLDYLEIGFFGLSGFNWTFEIPLYLARLRELACRVVPLPLVFRVTIVAVMKCSVLRRTAGARQFPDLLARIEQSLVLPTKITLPLDPEGQSFD